jgi:protease I
MNDLKGRRIAILATDGFEQSELLVPKKALEKSGADVFIISPEKGKIKGWDESDWGRNISVDETVSSADPDEYDALFIPGGVINPDKLRRDKDAVEFVRSFFDSNKPVAAICHGPQMLIEADVVKGRKLTSFHSIKKDLVNAGANWVDQEVVVDRNLITSRSPQDLDAFDRKLIEEISKVEVSVSR